MGVTYVKVVKLKLGETLVKSGLDNLGAVLGVPQLGGLSEIEN